MARNINRLFIDDDLKKRHRESSIGSNDSFV